MGAVGADMAPVPSPDRRTKIAFVGVIASLAVLAMIGDGLQLPPGANAASQNATFAFQVSWDTGCRELIAEHWRADDRTAFLARLLLIIDTLILVPSYVLCLVGVLGFLQHHVRCLAGAGDGDTAALIARHRLLTAMPLLPGAFDLLENVLTLRFLEAEGPLSAAWHHVLATAAWLKWGTLLLTLLIVVFLLVVVLRRIGVEAIQRAGYSTLLRLTTAGRICLLAFYPLLILGLGVVLLGFVPQSRDILFCPCQ